ncbi:hypothetical protein BCR32DRAFT_285122 [Anaeromyces robustus]|uniref:Condensation domain-containing protein n=1 Tax=Anaeromyces robustus TaxID=1754192 RepID=A0A1Y1WPT1_9FUNG|nr:hypothetical protein BCR32DRAFT_285122 [Anaeromyces robustus]|eukprot:ORX75492.1 hypothetical protein BCR32DRAFT_285122 [Anaeromyces robustus]
MANKNISKSFKFESFDMLQRLFIERKHSNSTMRFIIKLNGKLDIDQFKKTVQLAIEKFPLISCNYYEYFYSSCWKFQEYPIEDFVWIVENKTNNDDEMIMNYFFKDLDKENGPHIRFVIIQSPEHDSLCISINHMLCDATDFKNFIYMFCDMYSTPENASNYPEMGDRGLMQLFWPLSFKEQFNILRSKENSPNENIHLNLKGDPNRPFLETRTLSQEIFNKLKTYSKAKGVTLNDLFFTAMMRTFYSIFHQTVSILCDINLRKYIKENKTKGFTNMLTTINCNIGEELGDTFEETLNKVTQCLSKEKNDINCTRGLYLTELVMILLPYRWGKQLIDATYTPYPLEITNLGIIDKSKINFKNVQASSALLTGSTKYAPSFELSISSFDNIITFCINFYGTPDDQKIINEVLDNYIKELTSII